MTADVGHSIDARAALLALSIADLVIEIGIDGRVAFASSALTGITGYEASQLVGQPAIDLVETEDRFRVLRRFLRLKHCGSATAVAPFEFRARHANGRMIWLQGNPTLLRDDAGGQAIGWVDVLRSADGIKANEHRLAAAKDTAEAETKAQAEFLANMSHEIRTPLNSIIGFMQVLKRDGSLGEAQLGHVASVEKAGRNLLKVVNDVLDFSKIESGTIHLNERPFSTEVLVRDAAALIRPQAAEKGLDLVVEIGSGADVAVIGDADRLRQVLINLLSNAVKFTARGAVSLRLDAARSGSALDLVFLIADSGMGIAPDQLPRLFHRFIQANGTIARRFGGTGLGLAISKRLVEAMHGSIDVESTLDVGSRFFVRLKLQLGVSEASPMAHAGVTRLLAPARADTLHDRRLLVAEDVQINQRLVEAMLAPLGCKIDMVADGAEALHAVQQQDYALVLMDMQMPSLDGIAASKAIRALGGRFLDLPIVALTANVFPEEIERARAAGMNDVVTKPIDSDRLVSTVVKWANRRAVPEAKVLDTEAS